MYYLICYQLNRLCIKFIGENCIIRLGYLELQTSTCLFWLHSLGDSNHFWEKQLGSKDKIKCFHCDRYSEASWHCDELSEKTNQEQDSRAGESQELTKLCNLSISL
jgi:hypothetical protein